MKKRAKNLESKQPIYAQLTEFYARIRRAQEESRNTLSLPSFQFHQAERAGEFQEGFPFFNKAEMPVDIPSAAALFSNLCTITRETNEKLKQSVTAVELALDQGTLNLKDLLRQYFDEAYSDTVALRQGIDQAVLRFLVHMSIFPSLSALAQQIRDSVDTKNWLRGYCPVCGSLPRISFLKDEGRRFFLCSFCSSEWQSERLKCPFCENSDHKSLHYFYAEGDEAVRVDLCERCKHYIKTVDTRKLSSPPDLNLEDITTIHLDILATDRGFSRPESPPWGFQ